MLTSAQREELREAALEFLAIRPTAAFALSPARLLISKNQMVDFPFEEADLKAAMTFLHDKGLIKVVPDEMGSTDYYQIHADGSIYYERRRGRQGLEA